MLANLPSSALVVNSSEQPFDCCRNESLVVLGHANIWIDEARNPRSIEYRSDTLKARNRKVRFIAVARADIEHLSTILGLFRD